MENLRISSERAAWKSRNEESPVRAALQFPSRLKRRSPAFFMQLEPLFFFFFLIAFCFGHARYFECLSSPEAALLLQIDSTLLIDWPSRAWVKRYEDNPRISFGFGNPCYEIPFKSGNVLRWLCVIKWHKGLMVDLRECISLHLQCLTFQIQP